MAVKMEMTKGYGIIVGKVYGIEGKEPRKNDYLSELRVRVKTSNDHTVWVKVGGFFSSKLSVKLKGKGMEEAEEYSLGEVADVLQDYFVDGDDVLIRCGVEVNPYKDGSLDLVAYGIYSCKDPIDFESKDFEERNEITIDMVVQGELKGNSLVGTFVNYKGQEVSKPIEANYEPIKEYLKDIKMGDLLRVMLKMTTEPIYEEVEGKEDKKPTKTLMGRSIGGNSKRKIVGNKETIEIIDIEVDKTIKGKYDLSDEVGNDEELPF